MGLSDNLEKKLSELRVPEERIPEIIARMTLREEMLGEHSAPKQGISLEALREIGYSVLGRQEAVDATIAELARDLSHSTSAVSKRYDALVDQWVDAVERPLLRWNKEFDIALPEKSVNQFNSSPPCSFRVGVSYAPLLRMSASGGAAQHGLQIHVNVLVAQHQFQGYGVRVVRKSRKEGLLRNRTVYEDPQVYIDFFGSMHDPLVPLRTYVSNLLTCYRDHEDSAALSKLKSLLYVDQAVRSFYESVHRRLDTTEEPVLTRESEQ